MAQRCDQTFVPFGPRQIVRLRCRHCREVEHVELRQLIACKTTVQRLSIDRLAPAKGQIAQHIY
jgi:hypothetical protein